MGRLELPALRLLFGKIATIVCWWSASSASENTVIETGDRRGRPGRPLLGGLVPDHSTNTSALTEFTTVAIASLSSPHRKCLVTIYTFLWKKNKINQEELKKQNKTQFFTVTPRGTENRIFCDFGVLTSTIQSVSHREQNVKKYVLKKTTIWKFWPHYIFNVTLFFSTHMNFTFSSFYQKKKNNKQRKKRNNPYNIFLEHKITTVYM